MINDLLYLAGFFDGEGCIQIYKKRDKKALLGIEKLAWKPPTLVGG